ncbi:hypothetical protein QYE76_045665 [Lolium multiflorum]|uniref:Uncharacterized protein n=1 Tax=Lolium multiflorum TaxID=4521 RepID=A0AAD8TNE2_LOLMU|nr:hypothetical protein QYE76_045665 [Lolium multiflorum]
MTWTAIQFEDMERYAQKMEHHLRIEMNDCDMTKQILQENNLKYYELKEQRDELDAEVVQLKEDNEKLQDETFKQQAIILALQAVRASGQTDTTIATSSSYSRGADC